MKIRNRPASPKMEAAYQAAIAAVKPLDLTPQELLALFANITGKLIAYQDQTKMTGEMALAVVTQNIEQGNAQAVAALRDGKPLGSA